MAGVKNPLYDVVARTGWGAGPLCREAAFYPEGMGKVWVLDTETKGTGANMVPLDRVRKRPSAPEPLFVPRKPQPRPAEEPRPRPPRRFKVVDVMTRQTLVEDAGARETVEALRGVRSNVDVNVYVWHGEDERWRLLTLPEQRAIWDLAQD
jgi:hypothetical protein